MGKTEISNLGDDLQGNGEDRQDPWGFHIGGRRLKAIMKVRRV